MTNDNEWGWTSYRRTGWMARDPDGKDVHEYSAYFMRVSAPGILASGEVVERTYIKFWSHHPIPALRAILASGKRPAKFHGKQVEGTFKLRARKATA
jgi:hypothetical protein